ncbi:MAG: CBS domain-containing protein [Gammaproteobacteria bacterium]|nr:CBS domain-containing protein [Gammaproteobacteria bacterium]
MAGAYILPHQQADLDAFGALIGASLLYPDYTPLLPHGTSPDLHRLLRERPEMGARLGEPDLLQRHPATRVILVDCSQAERIGPPAALLGEVQEWIIYDHHPPLQGDIVGAEVHRAATGACTTLLVEALQGLRLQPSPPEASLMLLGILEDTDHLRTPNVTPRDLRACAWLVEQGADLAWAGEMLRSALTAEQIALLDRLLQEGRWVQEQDPALWLSAISWDGPIHDGGRIVHHALASARADAAIALITQGKHVTAIGRSRGNVPLEHIFHDLGGGGQREAAAAVLHDSTLAEAEQRLLRILQNYFGPMMHQAAAIMNRTIFTCPADTLLGEAAAALGQTPHRGMPVVENGRAWGYVHRQLLENGIRHGLAGQAVRAYAEPLPEVAPETPISTLRTLLLEAHHPMLAVQGETGPLQGIITATDLQRAETPLPFASERRVGRHYLHGEIHRQWGEAATSRLQELGRRAAAMGSSAYLVGGCVRDLLLQRSMTDIDVVIEGDALRLAADLAAAVSASHLHSHPRFGTATLRFADQFRLDLASSRVEHYPQPGALPIVQAGGIQADLWRRDFTINAMAIALNPASFGQLLDPYRGLSDLQEGRLRVLHTLSFIEDPTRILRALRFSARFRFEMEAHTLGLMKNALAIDIFRHLSGPRLWREIRYLLQLSDLLPALRLLQEWRLWPLLRPPPADPAALFATVQRALTLRDWFQLSFPREPLLQDALFLRILWHDIPWAERQERLNYFQVGGADEIQNDLQRLPEIAAQLARGIRPSQRRALLSQLRVEGILALLAGHPQGPIQAAGLAYLQTDRHLASPLGAKEIMGLGLAPGPAVGQWLKRLRDARLDGEISDKESARQWLLNNLKQPPRKP